MSKRAVQSDKVVAADAVVQEARAGGGRSTGKRGTMSSLWERYVLAPEGTAPRSGGLVPRRGADGPDVRVLHAQTSIGSCLGNRCETARHRGGSLAPKGQRVLFTPNSRAPRSLSVREAEYEGERIVRLRNKAVVGVAVVSLAVAGVVAVAMARAEAGRWAVPEAA